jgi:chromosome segregation ATPase
MNEMDEQIQRIEEKLSLLLKEYNLARKEIQRLQKENIRLNDLVQSYNDQSNKLHQKDEVLKINTGNLSSNTRKDLEKKIEAYLKDIDKCLALLHS